MTLIERGGFTGLRQVLGERAANRLAYVYRDRIQPTNEALTYRFDPRGRASRRRLEAMRDRYRGERCFIIGNGPSLKDTDLSRLRNEFTFGLNRGYLLFDRIGAPTTFLVAVNRHVVEQFGADLVRAEGTKFISWRSRQWIPNDADVTFVRRSRLFTFSDDVAARGAWEGATVTYVAMQIAFHLGFSEVILVGVDHSFATQGPANKLVTATESDPNHFDPNYFGPGVRWQLPDLEMSETAYRLAKDQFESSGRRIIDATLAGQLRVFPKEEYVRLTGPVVPR